jgi:hypothetical protein
MFGIGKLTTAVRTLTDIVLALAATVRDVNTGLRGRLPLDVAEDTPDLIDHKPEPTPPP